MRLFLFLIVSGLAAVARADAPDLPKAPEGFQWEWNEDIRAAFLKPTDWHVKKGAQNGTQGLFLTKEKIEDGGQFKTGFSVNVIPDITKKSGKKASEYAFAFVREAIKEKKNILSLQPPLEQGRLKTFGYRIKKDGTIVHAHLVADDQVDKLYLMMFESPEEEWEQAWKKGEPIMEKMYIEFPK